VSAAQMTYPINDNALEGALRIFEKQRGLILDELERQPSE
jgi:hypothetical protein